MQSSAQTQRDKNAKLALEARRSELLSAVKDLSERNRIFFFAWVLFASYVTLIVFSTTDVQLLRTNGTVTLPLVSAQLPFVAFYLACPILVVAVHFNLLQNLDTHGFKLALWAESWDGLPPRESLPAFIFDYAALERDGTFGTLVRVATDVLCFWLGPIVLAIILIRFSDFQNPLFTGWQAFFFAADVVIAIYCKRRQPKLQPPYSMAWKLAGAALASFGLSLTALAVMLVTALPFDFPPAHAIMRALQSESSFVAELLLPRLSAPGVHFLPSDMEPELRAKLDGKELTNWWIDSGAGVDWRNRRLAYANLEGADLRKANLSGAILTGASLGNTNLTGTTLAGTRLEGADLWDAKLHGAALRNASLRGAMAMGAKFTGATIWGTDFRDTWLCGASLILAQISELQMQRAKLRGSDFVGATLREVATQDWSAQFVDVTGATFYVQGDMSPAGLIGNPLSVIKSGRSPANEDDRDRKPWHRWKNEEGIFGEYLCTPALDGLLGKKLYKGTPQSDFSASTRNVLEALAPRLTSAIEGTPNTLRGILLKRLANHMTEPWHLSFILYELSRSPMLRPAVEEFVRERGAQVPLPVFVGAEN